MRKETLRITNLSIQSEREGFLDNISLNLYEGEALGILGSPNSGKTLLLKVISGKYFFEEGVFFLNEERVDSLQLLREGRMAFVQHNSALVENLSVSDNIFYIKKHKHIQFLSKQKLYERLTKQHLEEFQISINPKAVIGTLSEVEKCIIEILKAYIWGAKIILVDSFSAIHPVGEYVYLNELMERMKKKGISFIVTDYQMQHLQICSDRILIMSKGKAIKAFVNKRRNQIDLTKIFGLISYENKKNGIERSKEVIMECLGIYVDIFKNLSMKIYKGEIVALIDFGREGVNHLYNLLQYPRYICEGKIMLLGKDYRSRAALNQVAFIDFASDDKVIPYMTLEDNLCLASYKRFLKGVFVDSTRQRICKKRFSYMV